ncbi:hypothetical protein [Legionella gresilensis]|uniref:hypothetical protein n=1 Tax=Legionella gresilensis TaxID=91823 RepID=UPI001041A7DA|nr:hypothetical protein [Legionella gresilensis]
MQEPIERENLSSTTNTSKVENSIAAAMLADSTSEKSFSENSENSGSTNSQASPRNSKKRAKNDPEKEGGLLEDNNNNNNNIDINKRQKSHKNPRFLDKEGINRISFIVLNKNGIMEYAGIFKSSRDGNSFLLKQKTPYSGPNEFAYAYVVLTGEDENKKPVQIIFILGIMDYGDSNHPGVRMFAQKVAKYLENELKIIVHKKDYVYTGECKLDLPTGKTDLTIDDMKTMVGEKLTYLQFNLKGTKSSYGYAGESKPTLVTYIPRACILVSTEHTTAKGLRLDTPESYIDINGEVSKQGGNGKEEEKEENKLTREELSLESSKLEDLDGEILQVRSQSLSTDSKIIGGMEKLNQEKISGNQSSSAAFASRECARELSSIGSSATPASLNQAHARELSSINSSATPGFGFFGKSKQEEVSTIPTSSNTEGEVIDLQ